jgi:hypothetical protein
MPKILIKEFDNTSAGTPGNYANYAVLITGFANRTPVLTATAEADTTGKTKADKVQPDSNGVYEFTSAGDFKEVIGLVDSKDVGEGTSKKTEYHYGNKMAYELLNMGYTVIYKVIDKISAMDNEDFWAPFYDKASYDFRFVSHGMLETNCDMVAYSTLTDRLAVIKVDASEFAKILTNAETAYKTEKGEEAWTNLEDKEAVYTEAYGKSTHTGFLSDKGKKYSYAEAKANLTSTEGKCAAEIAQEALIAQHDEKHITPTIFNNINGHIAKLAAYTTDDDGNVINAGRGDCIALVELYEGSYVGISSKPEVAIIAGIEGMPATVVDNGAYCAMTVPSVHYNMSGNIVKFPGAFHYLACFMNSLRSGFSEWYAAAGYTRGVCGYSIDHTSVKLGEIAINALEPRNYKDGEIHPKFACNVIANFRGSYYLWGNRTAFPIGSVNSTKYNDLTASSFLNIRQLCTTIKKQLYVACRRFTFDPNSDTLWFNFVNAITPTLDAMKADQGIRDYRVIKVFTDKKATMKAKIRIIPIEAVEDFDIEVSLEDSFGGVSVNAN